MKKKVVNLNYVMLVLLVIKSMLHYSQIISLPELVEVIIELITYSIWAVTLINKKYPKKILLPIIIFALLILISSYKCGNYVLFSSFMLFCLTLFSDENKIISLISKTMIVIISLHLFYFIITYLSGNIYSTMDTSGRVRYGIGFTNPNIVSYYVLWAYIAFLYLKQKLKFVDTFVSLIIVFIIYLFTKSNTLLIMSILSIIILNIKSTNLTEKIVTGLCKYSFAGIMILLIFLIYLYKNGNFIGILSNDFLNNRIYYSYVAKENYGYTVLGQSVNFEMQLEREYSYMSKNVILDVTYSNILFRYGIFVAIILEYVCILIGKFGSFNQKKLIILWAIFAISEVSSLNFLICFPVIFGAKYIIKSKM